MRKKALSLFLILVLLLSSFPFAAVHALKPELQKQHHSQKNKQKRQKPGSVAGQSISVDYGFKVLSLNLPASMRAGQVIRVNAELKNTSSFDWESSIVKLTYHWVDQNGQYEVFRGDVTKLHKDLATNKSVTQKMQIRAPEIPGEFNLKFDLIAGNTWFTEEGEGDFTHPVTITGTVLVSDDPMVTINDGAEYANDTNVKLSFEELKFQPNSPFASFVYDYAQAGRDMDWGKWQGVDAPTWDLGIDQPFAGLIKVYARFRAFKKHSTATPESYGSAQYHYGRASKTTGAWWDEIFFDNIPPQGEIEINGGASSTTSRTVDLQISATDDLLGMTGSGLDGMRLDLNCTGQFGAWEPVASKSGVSLNGGSLLQACVQFKDKAGNISQTYTDSIIFFIPSGSGGGGGSALEPGNTTYVDANGNRIVSKLAGIPGNPYGDKTATGLGRAKINVSSIVISGQRFTVVTSVQVPPPEITYIDVNDAGTQVSIYGVALQKNVEADFELKYQALKEGCTPNLFDNCLEIKTKNFTGNLEHVGMSLYEETPWWWFGGHPELYWLWNDAADGRWRIDRNLNDSSQGDIDLGDRVYSRTRIWGKIDSGVPEIGIIDYGLGDKVISGYSNIETIRDGGVEYYKNAMDQLYSLTVVNGGAEWTEAELSRLVDSFENVPRFLYDHAYVNTVRREHVHATGGPNTLAEYDYSDTKDVIIFDSSFDTTLGGFTRYGTITAEEFFLRTAVHEMAHAYEEVDKANNSAKLLTDFSKVSWVEVSGVIYEKWSANIAGTVNTTVNYQNQTMSIGDFVSDYAMTATFEDWAESVTFQHFTPGRFDQGTQRLKNKHPLVQSIF